MQHHKVAVLVVALLFILSAGSPGFADARDARTEVEHRYWEDRDEIRELSVAQDLKGLTRKAEEVETEWSGRNKKYYGDLVVQICTALSSGPFRKEESLDLIRKYSLLAVEKCDPADPNNVSIESEFRLVGGVEAGWMYYREQLSDDEWASSRFTQTKRWLRTWQRLELEGGIDKEWDPEDLPMSNSRPPAATGLPSGVSPKAIKDPAMRAEYEAEIEKNRRKAQEYSKQYTLRKLAKERQRSIEIWLAEAYAFPPFSDAELRDVLDTYVADPEVRAKFLEASRTKPRRAE